MMGFDEREIGRRLGFPECCIEAWIQDDHKGWLPTGAMARGCVYNFRRENGTLRFYVPCLECIEEGPPEGWLPPMRGLTRFDAYEKDPGYLLQMKYASMFWKDGHYIIEGGPWVNVEIERKAA